MKTCLQSEVFKCVCSICHTRRKAFVKLLFYAIAWTFYRNNIIAVANGQTSRGIDDGGRSEFFTSSVPHRLYFKEHPVNSIVRRDDYILLNCSVAITSNLQLTSIKSSSYDIKWFKDNKELKMGGRRTLLSNGSLRIDPPLKHGGKTRDDGKYRCSVGYPGYTVLSQEAVVSFTALGKFTAQPVSVNLTVGDFHRFSCYIGSAHPFPEVRWFKDDVEVSKGDDLHLQRSHGSPKVTELVMSADRRRVAILPSGILEISRVAMRDAGSYHCVASNEARSRRSGRAVLRVFQGTRKPSEPKLTARPNNTSTTVDTSTVIDCGFSGDPAPRISWKKNGKLINMRHRNKYSFVGKGNLLIKNVESTDSGTYSCSAKNDFGLSQEYSAFLTVMVAPKFLHVPPQSYHAIVGDSVILRCSASGWPEPKISWYRNGIKIDNVKSILDLGNVKADEMALYQCFAENEIGANMSSTLLQIEQGSTYLADIGESPQISVPGVNPIISEPYDVAIVNISSSAVRLSWRPPREGSDAVTHYNVFVEDKDSDLREIKTTECSVIINSLQSGHQIRIKVVAFCGLISGASSRPITFIVPSNDNVLEGSVENLKAKVLSSTEILVSWDPPQTDSDPNRPVTGYKLSMEYVASSHMKTEEMIIKENYHKYEGLNQHTTYSFRVSVVTERRIGYPSIAVSATTFEGVPDLPPKNVSVSVFNSSSLRVSWFAPSQISLNGILQGYNLRYKPFGGKRFTTIEIPPEKNFLDLSGLRKNVEYIIEVQALTQIGGGPFSRRQVSLSPLIVKNEVRPPEKPLALSTQEFSREIALMWMPPGGSRLVRKYKINWGQNTPYENQRVIDYTQRMFRITDLEPRTSYIIAVQAINNAGPGEESLTKTRTKSLKLEELYPPLGVQAKAISHNAINVTWYDKDHDKNTYYEVRYKTNFPSQLETSITNSTEMFLALRKLKPYKQYEISVRAIHSKRKSSWSMTAVESTFETKPESPPTFIAIMPVFEDPSTVLIRWKPPDKSNGNITGYLIFYSTNANDDISEWVVEPVLGDHSSREVKGLTTDTLYLFKMQARNAKGMGPYSSIIQFQTSKGQAVNEAHKTKITKTPIFYLAIGCVLVLILVVVMVSSIFMFRHYQVHRKNKKGKSEMYGAQVCIGRKKAAAQAVSKPRKTPMNVCELWMRSDYKTRLIANKEQVDQHAVFCSCNNGSVPRNDELRTKIIGSRSSSYSRESSYHVTEYDENNDR